MKKTLRLFGIAILSIVSVNLFAQATQLADIQEYLSKHQADLKPADYQNLIVTNFFRSEQNGATYLYASQAVNGIRISNSSLTAVFDKDGKLRNVASKLFEKIDQRANSPQAKIDLSSAVSSQLSSAVPGLQIHFNPAVEKNLTISGANFNHATHAELVYYSMPEGELKLAWSFDCSLPSKEHWYHYFVDAQSGELLKKIDWQVSCSVAPMPKVDSHFQAKSTAGNILLSPEDGSGYRVFEFPIESPNHGVRTLAVEPATVSASPYGWHDINGADGAEYTITRGNNVYAYEDVNDQDVPGFSPDGGTNLLFDFPYDPDAAPETYQSAAITNLFYANNRIHDILYQYGFDEASGNFQTTNYSGNGIDDDEVRAESQDGGGLNNANFGTPPDGFNPTMQMYLWQSGLNSNIFHVNTPEPIAGGYLSSGVAEFGPEIPNDGITADLILADDNTVPDPLDGCQPIINDLTGKIAILYRGSCDFTQKVVNAQNAGAVACIVINNAGDGVIEMGGFDNSISIPSLMIGQSDGETIIAEMELNTVNATLNANVMLDTKDGSFDNGIMTHEYCHGLSTRLTGGSSNSDCLWNEEQMGEGWSDWYALMLTMNMDTDNPVHRPMATFAAGEAITGNGIRPVPYDTSMAVNPYTYADLGSAEASETHGVGFVWCTMLWDLTWAFIDEYGYDPDIDTGTGGNNMLLQLVTDALKLQVCSPGFVDGRDAILLADEIDNDGANKCMIWKVFARRGLGYSASQGSSESVADGVAAYDLPPICLTSTAPPIADFSNNLSETCNGLVQFTDESENVPQFWSWDFGDGTTSDEQNPLHTYESEGVYTVTLTVSNELGEDSFSQTDLIEYTAPTTPDATGASGCTGDSVVLNATAPEGEIQWLDATGDVVAEGSEFSTQLMDNSANYYAQSVVSAGDDVHVGPVDTNFGTGGNHATSFVGTVDFTTYQPLIIHTADVVSGATGQHVISLYGDISGGGDLLQQRIVDIDFTGAGTIDLDFEIDEPGSYSIGLNQANLFRNDSGAEYPYEAPGLMKIVGSSAGPGFYYYFYNLKVGPVPCVSEAVEVTAEVLGNASFSTSTDGLTVSFTNESGGATSWLWTFGDGETSNEENPTHTYAESGTFTVSLQTDISCASSQDIELTSLGIDAIQNSGFSVVPNPADGAIHVENKSTDGNISRAVFYDLQGRIVKDIRLKSGESWTLNVRNIPAGMYMFSILNDNNRPVFRKRLLIMH